MTEQNYQTVCFEAVIALDNLSRAFMWLSPNALHEKKHERLMIAMQSEKDNFEDLPDVIKRVSGVMRDIYYDMTGDTSKLSDVRKKVDELGSILHIGRSYPRDAARRAKNISMKYDPSNFKKERTKNDA